MTASAPLDPPRGTAERMAALRLRLVWMKNKSDSDSRWSESFRNWAVPPYL